MNIKCKTEYTCRMPELLPFQGESKKRKDSDIDSLINSLKNDGLLQPISVWREKPEDKWSILDGHGRYSALAKMALSDASVIEIDLPILPIEAETRQDAIKACLQMMSMYGKINKEGVREFAAELVDYEAPCLVYSAEQVIVDDFDKLVEDSVTPVQAEERIVVKLSVAKDKSAELLAILRATNFVEIL